tara:strand:- start:48 stop:209 length:162 start_codon:yes stop_codon:yes gene_type:complete
MLPQNEKHLAASDVHFLTPFIEEILLLVSFGSPNGSALTGHESAHLEQILQKS